MSETALATARQKVQYLESMIGFVDIDPKDHSILVGAINIYKAGNEPLYTSDEIKWLNKCVEKYTVALAKANEPILNEKHMGSSFDDFLKEDGIYEEVTDALAKANEAEEVAEDQEQSRCVVLIDTF